MLKRAQDSQRPVDPVERNGDTNFMKMVLQHDDVFDSDALKISVADVGWGECVEPEFEPYDGHFPFS